MTFPKPGQTKKKREPVKIFPDGREVCANTALGKIEYKSRVHSAWVRDFGMCGICGLYVRLDEATGDHRKPRGMGGSTRDDRIENLQPAHFSCNAEKASQRNFTKKESL